MEKLDKDLGLRHKSDMTSDKFIELYCPVFREHAYATKDDSLNEFEKLITHVLETKIRYQQLTGLMGLESVGAYEAVEASSSLVVTDELRELIRAVNSPMDKLQLKLAEMLKEGKMGGYASDVEIRNMAHAVALTLVGK